MPTIPNTDVAETYDATALSEDGAEAAFLAKFNIDPEEGDDEQDAPPKKKKPSAEVEKVETTEDGDDANEEANDDENSDESPEDEDAEGDDEAADEKPADKKYVDSDETYVKVKIGDEEKEVSVKDLKRLYGQEASLTRKSQEVAEQRRVADDSVAKNLATMNVLLEKAKAKAAPYAAIDWLAVSKNSAIDAETASALRDEAKAALDDVAFLENGLGGLMTALKEKATTETAAQAKVCIASLSTPGTDEKPNALFIEGWNDKVYDDLRSFARELGADANAVNSMVDPVAFKVLHMAMQFKKGSSKVLTVKTKKSPTKIVKTSSSTPASKGPASVTDRNKAMTNLRRTGSEEAARDAFMAGMRDGD